MTYHPSQPTSPVRRPNGAPGGGSPGRGDILQIPALAELGGYEQWVTWTYQGEVNPNTGKRPKMLKNPRTGGNAMSNNAQTWTGIAEARAAMSRRGHEGLGFVFTEGDPYTGIDLDHCIEHGQIKPLAWEIIRGLDSYAEISPSGTGVKIYCAATTLPRSLKVGDIGEGIGLEMYDRLRWFAVTGQHVPGTPTTINDAHDAVAVLFDAYAPAPPAPVLRPVSTGATTPADDAYPRRWVEAIVSRVKATAADKVALAPAGHKHNARLAAGELLGGYIAGFDRIGYGHLLSAADAEHLLYHANPPVANHAMELKTLRDAIAHGMQKPLDIDRPPPKPGLAPRQPASTPPDDGPPLAQVPAEAFSPVLMTAPKTDAGNAECLAELYGDVLRYCRTSKKWMHWTGARWDTDATATAWRLLLTTVRERRFAAVAQSDGEFSEKLVKWSYSSENTKNRTATLKAAESLEVFDTVLDAYDKDPMIAGAPNGTLDLTTQAIRPAAQDDMLTMHIGTAYDPDATCPRWSQFMDEITGNDADLVAYIQRAVGYSLTGSTREQKLFLLYGEGRNGKSTFLTVLGRLFGDYAGNTAFEMLDAEQRGQNTSDLAALKGKRFVSILESDQDRYLAEARVKIATGNDLIHCRFLYCEPFDYRPHFKIWMAMNHLPRIRGADEGIWRRIQLVPFLQRFADAAQDKDLESKLLRELPGILNWALDGLRQWLAVGLGEPAVVTQATAEYRSTSDTVGQFLDEYTINDAEGEIDISELYRTFYDWAKDRGELRPLSQPSLGKQLNSRGYQSTRRVVERRKRTFYHGLRLRLEWDT